MRMWDRPLQITAMTAVLIVQAGCSPKQRNLSDSISPQSSPLYQPMSPTTIAPELLLVRPMYRLNVGDRVEISFQRRNVVRE